MSITECKSGDIVYYTIGNYRVYDMINSITTDDHGRNTHINLALSQYVPSFNYKKFEYGKGDFVNLGKQYFKINYFVIMENKVYIVTDRHIYIPMSSAWAFYTPQEYKDRMDYLRAKEYSIKLAVNSVYGIHAINCTKVSKTSITNLAKEVYKLKNKALTKAFEDLCKDASITITEENKFCKYINGECVCEEIK